jgi:D-3-phosphoglycerate dehydrogenase
VSVAELAMAQLLSLARRLPAADASMKQGKWDKKSFQGEEVRGKVLGLVGLGRVGQEVSRRARAFAMSVIAHDPFIPGSLATGLGTELVSLDELCERAHYISLHLPASAETRHLFNAERFAKCKRGVKLINTARGELIDEPALVEAIRTGQVGGAALDVFTQEPTTNHDLQQLPQVIASPHIAASTREGQEQVGIETAEALRDFLKTGTVRNAVNGPF